MAEAARPPALPEETQRQAGLPARLKSEVWDGDEGCTAHRIDRSARAAASHASPARRSEVDSGPLTRADPESDPSPPNGPAPRMIDPPTGPLTRWREEGRRERRQELTAWLERFRQAQWTVWGHFTFRNEPPPSADDAHALISAYLGRAESRLFRFPYLGVIEGDRFGAHRTHAHMVFAGIEANRATFDLLKELWLPHGASKIEAFQPGRGGFDYVFKNITRGALLVGPPEDYRHRSRCVRRRAAWKSKYALS